MYYGEMIGVVLNQEISELVGVELVTGREIGHQVVVEIVVASHSNEEQASSHRVCNGHRNTGLAGHLIQRCLEVMNLLVEWYTPHLIIGL